MVLQRFQSDQLPACKALQQLLSPLALVVALGPTSIQEVLMVSLAQLWLPILLSPVLVFVASSLIHMVIKWHNSDYLTLPNEDEVRAAIRKGNPKPGQYVVPHFPDMNDLKKPEAQQKYVEGPVGFLTLRASGLPSMGLPLVLWFVFSLVVSLFAAYLASRTLPAGTHYLRVCRVAGAVSFLAYAGGAVPSAIWMGKPWRSAAKEVADGFIYGLLTAVAFGFLWPR
jgi:hypothetical protein